MRTEKTYVLDPTDMECGENGKVYATTEVLHIEKNGLILKLISNENLP